MAGKRGRHFGIGVTYLTPFGIGSGSFLLTGPSRAIGVTIRSLSRGDDCQVRASSRATGLSIGDTSRGSGAQLDRLSRSTNPTLWPKSRGTDPTMRGA